MLKPAWRPGISADVIQWYRIGKVEPCYELYWTFALVIRPLLPLIL